MVTEREQGLYKCLVEKYAETLVKSYKVVQEWGGNFSQNFWSKWSKNLFYRNKKSTQNIHLLIVHIVGSQNGYCLIIEVRVSLLYSP